MTSFELGNAEGEAVERELRAAMPRAVENDARGRSITLGRVTAFVQAGAPAMRGERWPHLRLRFELDAVP